MYRRVVYLLVPVLLLPSMALAQPDFSSMSFNTMSWASNMVAQNVALQNTLDGEPVKPSTNLLASSDAARASVSTSYQASPALTAQVRSELLARIRGSNPKLAEQVAAQMRQHDFGRVYSDIIAPFGLKRGDVADAMAAYTVLGWMIATGKANPTPEQVAAVRRQVAHRLAIDDGLADPQRRARLGEELALLFVTLHASWQSGLTQEGPEALDRFSDGVNAMFQKQTGKNLRNLILTDEGFRSRG